MSEDEKAPLTVEPRYCDFCGVLLEPKRHWQRFCCEDHRYKFRNKRKLESGEYIPKPKFVPPPKVKEPKPGLKELDPHIHLVIVVKDEEDGDV